MATLTIKEVLAVPAIAAGDYTDLAASQATGEPHADQYGAQPVTPGFTHAREVGEAVSVGLVLEPAGSTLSDVPPRHIVWGDCVGMSRGAVAGRPALFRTADGLRAIRRHVAPLLEGRKLTSFRQLATEIDILTETALVPAPEPDKPHPSEEASAGGLSRRDLLTAPLRFLREDAATDESDSPERHPEVRTITVERPLHPAVRYGVSQALLKGVAVATGQTMAEVIADEWHLPHPTQPVLIHAQAPVTRSDRIDRMVVRGVDSLGLTVTETTPDLLGADGQGLVRSVQQLKARIEDLGRPKYRPVIHLDVRGALGRLTDQNLGRILGYLLRLESHARPYPLRLESPLVMDSRADQIETLKTLREYAQFRDMDVEIVADEWVNTLDDVEAFLAARAADMVHLKTPALGGLHQAVAATLLCQEAGIRVLLGGSPIETDSSAQATAHVALSTQPAVVMAKPGDSVAYAVASTRNEMARALASIRHAPPPTTATSGP